MLTILSSIIVHAEDTIELNQTTVKSSPRSSYYTLIPKEQKNTYVITQEKIRERNYKNVEDVLRDAPGVTIQNTAFGPRVDMRGSGKKSLSRVKVLVDGVSINPTEETIASLPINSIPIESLKKIEIIPGGGANTNHKITHSKRSAESTPTNSTVKGTSAYLGTYYNQEIISSKINWINGLGVQYGSYKTERNLKNNYLNGEVSIGMSKTLYDIDGKSNLTASISAISGLYGYKNDDLKARIAGSPPFFNIKGDKVKKDAVKILIDYNVQKATGFNYGLEGTYISNSAESNVKIGVKAGYTF